MKIKIVICIIFSIVVLSQPVEATMQFPDRLFYNDEQYDLFVHWADPSPLELYYLKLRAESPFIGLSTANYRGFIATWHVVDESLYLTGIPVLDAPIPLDVIWGEEVIDGKVHASWVTGYVRCYSESASLLLKIH